MTLEFALTRNERPAADDVRAGVLALGDECG